MLFFPIFGVIFYSMIDKIRIHLADDHQVLIDGMRTLLNTVSNFEVIGFSLDGSTLYDEVTNNQANILILDISMPKKDGIEVIKEFAKKGYPCKVIILSSYDDLKIIKEVMKLGASGYLTKQCAGENIVEAIQAVANGEEYFCKSVREKIFNSATKDNSKLNKENATIDSILTGREVEIITLIALEHSGKEISEKLFISTNTVETHRKNIMKKLKAKNTISLVKFAIKNKLIKS
ncbi:two component transcriptional regulator, LuxR family [Flavobacterium frigoris]|uniref:Two component transcriptional regulator, LuxR family n=2 Tax=Flavobacterium frigoris TaxID=229204 RepID=A0A1H9JST4_FLAFI|nr:two component transcriptional regulator, LuxR family [Flavobacterium frigoris]